MLGKKICCHRQGDNGSEGDTKTCADPPANGSRHREETRRKDIFLLKIQEVGCMSSYRCAIAKTLTQSRYGL